MSDLDADPLVLRQRLEALEVLVDQQRQVIDEQGTILERLLEGRQQRSSQPIDDQAEATMWSRRSVIGRAGIAAAAASVGAIVLGSEPAAAAAGTFDGNPAVTGTASPTSGIGVRGVTSTGTGVRGEASTSAGIGVVGESAGTTGVGAKGIVSNAGNLNGYGVLGTHAGAGVAAVGGVSSGLAHGVYGSSADPDGIGIFGRNAAASPTFENFPIGVFGKIDKAEGYAVRGEVTDTTGSFAVGVSGYVVHPKGIGVLGEAVGPTDDTSTGVRGSTMSAQGIGVDAVNTALTGAGTALSAKSSSTGAVVLVSSGRSSQLKLTSPAGLEPAAPTSWSTARTVGELVFDANEDLWLCVVAGTPGVWRKISGPSTGGAFHPLATPKRVYDSRPGTQPSVGTKSPLVASTPRAIDCTVNASGVPAGAVGVLATLLVVNSTATNGNMTLWADGVASPATNNALWTTAGERASVLTYTNLSPTGRCQVRANQKTDVVLDIVGYYR